MQLQILWESAKPAQVPLSARDLRALLAFCAKELRSEPEWLATCQSLGSKPRSVGLLFCDDQVMRGYNKRYRKIDKTTDVLSFPAAEGVAAPGVDSLGDLIVSIPAVERGAQRGKRTVKAELFNVLIHGFLHLLGCDHVGNPRKARRMFALQKKLFARAKRDMT